MVFRVWDIFREDENGGLYSGMYSTWEAEKDTFFDITTYTYNNYYILGPTYGDRVFRNGKHGFVFHHVFDCQRDQLFGIISIKDENVENVKEYMNRRKSRFDHHDRPHHPNLSSNVMVGMEIRYNYHPIFTEVDFFGFSPISGKKVHNITKSEDVIVNSKNLSEEFRKNGFSTLKCVVLVDLEKKTMELSVSGYFGWGDEKKLTNFGVLFDNLNKGAVLPVFFYSTRDFYKLFCIY